MTNQPLNSRQDHGNSPAAPTTPAPCPEPPGPPWRLAPLPLGEVAELPATVDLMTAARALQLGRTTAYRLAKSGEFPCRVVKIGALYRIPTAELLRVLGVDSRSGHA